MLVARGDGLARELAVSDSTAAIYDALGACSSAALLAGTAGTIWLIRTGTWPHMWDVLLNWNQEYYKWSWADLGPQDSDSCPFTLCPTACCTSLPCQSRSIALFRRKAPQAILAALYLGWLTQATVIQKVFDYAHAPPTLAGDRRARRASLASRTRVSLLVCDRRARPRVRRESETLSSMERAYPLTTHAVVPHHPIVRSERLALWGRCWHDGSWELKDQLTYYPCIHCAPNWADSSAVADFLRDQGVKDHDVICWHDSTHPLYVWLDIKPGIRFPHVITAMKFRSKLDVIRAETFASPARFVVSDLVPVSYLTQTSIRRHRPQDHATNYHRSFPHGDADVYPWNQPVVFRAGRFFVHEIKNPHGEIDFPLPDGLKRLISRPDINFNSRKFGHRPPYP